MNKKIKLTFILWIVVMCLLTSGIFTFLYHCDNKYTRRAQVFQENTTRLTDTENGQNDDIVWLVEGWEFCPDQLIFHEEKTDTWLPLYIGQFFSFSKFHSDGSPYGIGTYRLVVEGNGTYSLLLPEVFSACNVYVNGELQASSGSITPYQPEVKDLVVPLVLDGKAEILIQTANYTHYYSGLTYPPAVGSSEAISRLIAIRMIFYGFLSFTSLAFALFAVVIWWNTKRIAISRENFWLGILALSFSLRLSYPFIHMFHFPFSKLSYILENSMAALGLFCAVQTVTCICMDSNSFIKRVLTGISAGFIPINVIFPAAILPHIPGFIPVYGQMIYWYKFITAIVMILLLLVGYFKKPSNEIILLMSGLFVYAGALLTHTICLGHYEPAFLGWFEEWGSYILIICFTIRMALRNIEIIRENRHLNEHLKEEIARKTETLSKLLEERQILFSGFAHDLKTPITSITTFTRLMELDNSQLDDEARQYLDIIRNKTVEIQQQLNTFHKFLHIDTTPCILETVDLCQLVQQFFDQNKPDLDVNGIQFELIIPDKRSILVQGDKTKLTSVLQNLVYNAMSFTPEGGVIWLKLSRETEWAVLCIEDTGCGIAQEDLSHIFDRFYTIRSNHDGDGMGLFLVKSIITQHRGTIDVSSVLNHGTSFTIKIPSI